jgi:hypothetical protein
VVDGNEVVDQFDLGGVVLEKLTTLSVNDNKIDNVEVFLSGVKASFPNVTFLSMLKNPCCPNYFMGKDQEDYKRYRLFVISMFPNLKFLDSSQITKEERAEAGRVGHLMRVAKPQHQAPQAPREEEVSVDNEEDSGPSRGKQSFGMSRYVYYGKQSEGNRFITNDEL